MEKGEKSFGAKGAARQRDRMRVLPQNVLESLRSMPFFILFLATSAVAQGVAAKTVYVVTKPVTNIYRLPTQASDVVSQAIFGTNVELIGTKDDWANIRTADNYTGWVRFPDLKKINGQPYASRGEIVKVAQLSANIYGEPDVTLRAPIVTIPWESRLEVVAANVGGSARWLKVRLPDDSEAYVQSGDISSEFTPLTIPQTIALSKRFLGVTYTWGGTSAFGFDCSGFMQMLQRQRGVLMPRDADQQAVWDGSVAIERKDLQPGDLLYFGDSDEITHTGMYIGDGEFIHDTTHEQPKVQISRLDDSPWSAALLATRRVKP